MSKFGRVARKIQSKIGSVGRVLSRVGHFGVKVGGLVSLLGAPEIGGSIAGASAIAIKAGDIGNYIGGM